MKEFLKSEWVSSICCRCLDDPLLNRSASGVTTGYQFGECMISQMGGLFNYDHEYLGPTPRLIFTPLTERAYLSLSIAMKSFACGTLIGPQGSGKSETIRDLACVSTSLYSKNIVELHANNIRLRCFRRWVDTLRQ